MRNSLALVIAAALTATAAALAVPAQAHERWPVIPDEVGVAPRIDRLDWLAYRCAFGPVYNFYHGAYYGGEPPAVYRGYALPIGRTIATRPIACCRGHMSATPDGNR